MRSVHESGAYPATDDEDHAGRYVRDLHPARREWRPAGEPGHTNGSNICQKSDRSGHKERTGKDRRCSPFVLRVPPIAGGDDLPTESIYEAFSPAFFCVSAWNLLILLSLPPDIPQLLTIFCGALLVHSCDCYFFPYLSSLGISEIPTRCSAVSLNRNLILN